jgi:N-acetylglucosamine malate deacetylase 1
MRTALIVAAHPDDEVLGCGGTMARLADNGWNVHVLILAEGATSRSNTRDRHAHAQELSALALAADSAGQILGARSVRLESYPDNRMNGVEMLDVVQTISAEVERVRPERVFTHHPSDVNVDHGVVHNAVIAATRPLPGSCVREVACFEVASSTEWRGSGSTTPFVPNLFIDVEATLARKMKALEAYACEMRPFPHPRSLTAIEHLARWRGASCGCGAAEAFHITRRIE